MNFKITKSILALCVLQLCCTSFLRAQTISTAYATQINSTFAGVDKSKVPYHLLKDYAMEFTELAAYKGVLTDTNYVQRVLLNPSIILCLWHGYNLYPV